MARQSLAIVDVLAQSYSLTTVLSGATMVLLVLITSARWALRCSRGAISQKRTGGRASRLSCLVRTRRRCSGPVKSRSGSAAGGRREVEIDSRGRCWQCQGDAVGS
jgi:hypothetical protein